MFIKQLSVFIENQEGRLEEVLDVLKQEQVSIISRWRFESHVRFSS